LTGKYRPPAIPVIPEETEKDEEFKNFRLVPLTGKCQPPTMTAISEETDPGDIQVDGGPLLGGSAGYSRASISSCHYQHYACYLCQ